MEFEFTAEDILVIFSVDDKINNLNNKMLIW